jgi:putative oxidoreductase
MSLPLAAAPAWLEDRREYGTIFIRLCVGYRLVYGTIDNVASWARMVEFEHFLAAHGVPFALLSAVVSVWAQFLCGLLFIVGLWTRPAGAVMVVNFIVAIVVAHIGRPYLDNFDAIMMLAAGAFFLFHGAGALSVESWLASRGATRRANRSVRA